MEEAEKLPYKVKCMLEGDLPLPSFILFDRPNMRFSISPTIPKHAGLYTLEVTLNDQFSPPNIARFKVTVDDPLAVIRNTKNNTIKGAEVGGNKTEVVRGTVKVRRVTRDHKMIVKFISPKNTEGLMRRAINESFAVYWIKSLS